MVRPRRGREAENGLCPKQAVKKYSIYCVSVHVLTCTYEIPPRDVLALVMASHFSLPVVLTQLRPGLNVADYEHVGIDPRCGLLLFLRADGDLFASKLESPTDDGHFAKKILSKVRR